MKIYTLTFVIYNYGSILQAFALQSVLRFFNSEPIILLPVRKPRWYLLRKFPQLITLLSILKHRKNYNLYQRIKLKLDNRKFVEKRKKIDVFKAKNLCIMPVSNIAEFNCSVKPEDIFLAGSDQIWNTLDGNLSPWYSLQWVKGDNEKYSYAASIGLSQISEYQKDEYISGLSHFNILSFREVQATNMFEPLFPGKVRQDLDPTLLYDNIFWRKHESSRLISEPYIFVYMLRPDMNVMNLAKRVAAEKHCKVIYTGILASHFDGVITVCDAGIEDFLSYMDNAEAVVTNSFHGTAFSILFEKPFLSVKLASTSSRVESLLCMTGLISQLVEGTVKTYNFSIDFAKAQRVLAEERQKSLDYLKSICQA